MSSNIILQHFYVIENKIDDPPLLSPVRPLHFPSVFTNKLYFVLFLFLLHACTARIYRFTDTIQIIRKRKVHFFPFFLVSFSFCFTILIVFINLSFSIILFLPCNSMHVQCRNFIMFYFYVNILLITLRGKSLLHIIQFNRIILFIDLMIE